MSVSQTPHGVRIAFDPAELCYNFSPDHPMQPARIEALLDLLTTAGLWKPDEPLTRLAVRTATIDELKLAHTTDYIEAVQRLSEPETEVSGQERARLALHYGFDGGDTPAVPNMHDVSATIAGGTLVAMSAVMGLPEGGSFADNERPLHVFHPSGGLHHAWAERASGFCIYNDAAVAIAHVLRATEAKVLYIDFDAHHGDGVQRAFYDEPRVMTISLHETARGGFSL